MAVFDRRKQVDELIDSIGDHRIKIITGIRRCGKTYLLKNLLPAKLKEKGFVASTSDVLVIEMNGKNKNIKTKNQLIAFLTNKTNKGKPFIVIDEIQKIPQFHEVLIAYLQNHPKKEIFVTGSNSQILSGSIVRDFQENGLEIHLAPLTFEEIRESIPDYDVDDYLKYGGLPFIVNEKPEKKEPELRKIYAELYEADIKERMKNQFPNLSKKKVLEILKAIFSTTNEVSIKGIVTRLTKGIDPSRFDDLELSKEVEDAIQMLADAYLIQEYENDSFDGLNILKNLGLNKKYYCTDNGLLFINCEDDNRVDGIVMENAIYLYLLSKGINARGKVLLGRKGERIGEVDFNCRIGSTDWHIQSTYDYHDGDYEREIGNLLRFEDCSKKLLVYRKDSATLPREPRVDYVDCETFLLEGEEIFKLF